MEDRKNNKKEIKRGEIRVASERNPKLPGADPRDRRTNRESKERKRERESQKEKRRVDVLEAR